MSSAINDGGPAFPLADKEAEAFAKAVEDLGNDTLDTAERTYYQAQHAALSGMTLRDYFAGLAMQGLLAQAMGMAAGSDPCFAAQYAYQTADAMLASLARSSGGMGVAAFL